MSKSPRGQVLSRFRWIGAEFIRVKIENETNESVHVVKTILNIGFPQVSPLGEGFQHIGPEIRILREMSALNPDSQAWSRKPSLKILKSALEI